MNLEERIARLERDNRRWKRITLLVALAPGSRRIMCAKSRQRLGAAAAPLLCRWLLPPLVATASPPLSPSYQAAIGFPGEPVAPTSLSGAQVNRNS
jgi:hypothetical protein